MGQEDDCEFLNYPAGLDDEETYSMLVDSGDNFEKAVDRVWSLDGGARV